jgi:hypothetical protein
MKELNSILIAKVSTSKPTLTRSLPKQLTDICRRAGVDEKEVKAPSTAIVKSDLVKESFKLINGMTPFLRKGKEGVTGEKLKKGLAVEDIVGASYVKAADVEAIQKEFDARRSNLDRLIESIGNQYGDLIRERLARLGGLRFEIEIPSCEEFLADFGFGIEFRSLGVGVSNDVLDQVSGEVAARLRANNAKVQDEFRAAHAQPIRTCISELTETIGQLVDGKRLRQERLDKVVAAAADMREQNWLGLPDLSGLATKLEGLAAKKEDLPDAAAREAHADKAKAVKAEAENVLAGFGI